MRLTHATRLAVLLPAAPTPTEEFAAGELKKYLAKMLGTVCVTKAEEAEVRFLIGGPERNAATAQYLSVEEFCQTVPGPRGC